jgi:hypothetical protein
MIHERPLALQVQINEMDFHSTTPAHAPIVFIAAVAFGFMNAPRSLRWVAILLLAAVAPLHSAADSPPGTVWQYTLLPESQLTDDCDICGRPTIIAPLRGMFQLRFLDCGPLFCHYGWEQVLLRADSAAGNQYYLEGSGSYSQGGELFVSQNLTLALYTDPGHTNEVRYFTNTTMTIERRWPMIKISLDETNPTLLQHLRLEISAAPLRELWFSTRSGFTAGIWNSPTNHVSAGDLVSSAARIVKNNGQLTAALGFMPPVPDVGLKDVDLLPGGEIAFSIETNIFSEKFGHQLQPGDLLSDFGRLVATNGELLAAFDPDPSAVDPGLAAVQILDSGEINFSVQRRFFSQALQRWIGTGDLLSSRGVVLRRNADLLAPFYPADPSQDYGLAAVYLWPNGEIWFSTALGFTSTNSTVYSSGDLLSDQGYVVYRNLDLLAAFAPLEDLNNFGLDALFVITDATPPPPAGYCRSIVAEPATGNVELQFSSRARVWQVERTPALPGNWMPVSPIMTDSQFVDFGIIKQAPLGFYRLHEW